MIFKDKHPDEFLGEFMLKMNFKNNHYNKRHYDFEKMYSNIMDKYVLILSKKVNKDKKNEFIKFEKYRIINNKFSIESNTNVIMLTLFVLSVTIAITILAVLSTISIKGKSILVIIYIGVTLVYCFKAFRENVNVKIYDIAINVLNDIEKEINKAKIKKEADEKDNQNLTEQVIKIKNLIDDLVPAFSKVFKKK